MKKIMKNEASFVSTIQEVALSEKQETQSFHEFSSQEIEGMMVSQKFADALDLAAKYTADEGHESHFVVRAGEDKGELFIPEVIAGVTDRVDTEDGVRIEVFGDKDQLEKMESQDKKVGSVFDFHFHPAADGPIVPSAADLGSYERVGLGSVGQVRMDGAVDMLVLKRRLVSTVDHRKFYAEDDRIFSGNQRLVNEAIVSFGMDVWEIRFKKTSDGYKLDEASRKVIESIGKVRVPLFRKGEVPFVSDEEVKSFDYPGEM